MEVREAVENNCSGKEEGRNRRPEDSSPLTCKQELTEEEEEEEDDEEYFRKEEVQLSRRRSLKCKLAWVAIFCERDKRKMRGFFKA